MATEQWQRVGECPNYAVSDQGRVYSYKRRRVMELPQQTAGYLQVGLYHNKKRLRRMVSHLVLQAFGDEAHFGDRKVVHLDGDPGNCAFVNLQLMTRSELAMYHRSRSNGEPNKLSLEAAREIRKRSEAGASLSALSKEYGVTTSSIHAVIKNEVWKDQ